MRAEVVIALIALSFGSACTGSPPASGGGSSAGASVSAGEVDIPGFAKAKADGKVAVLVDVRTEREFAAGHVEGAIHIPLDQLHERMDELEAHKTNPVHVICQAGGRSARAKMLLDKAGYNAINVQGGTGGWIRAGHPVVK